MSGGLSAESDRARRARFLEAVVAVNNRLVAEVGVDAWNGPDNRVRAVRASSLIARVVAGAVTAEREGRSRRSSRAARARGR